MLTKLTIRNFKRFENVEIELDNPVVFIGPNNSGKTSAMQAPALWDTGLKRWNEKRLGKAVSGKRRRGAAVNRRDIPAGPVAGAARHRQTRRPGAASASPAARCFGGVRCASKRRNRQNFRKLPRIPHTRRVA